MTAYTTIPDSELAPDAPARSINAIQLRDNPIAITEGASGAPRNVDASLDTTATTAGRDWVLARTALAAVGTVGTYAFLLPSISNGGIVAAGATRAGSTLRYANSNSFYDGTTHQHVGGTPSGTWRCMGVVTDAEPSAGVNGGASLFLRTV